LNFIFIFLSDDTQDMSRELLMLSHTLAASGAGAGGLSIRGINNDRWSAISPGSSVLAQQVQQHLTSLTSPSSSSSSSSSSLSSAAALHHSSSTGSGLLVMAPSMFSPPQRSRARPHTQNGNLLYRAASPPKPHSHPHPHHMHVTDFALVSNLCENLYRVAHDSLVNHTWNLIRYWMYFSFFL
jgi:hypothetical protein